MNMQGWIAEDLLLGRILYPFSKR